MWHAWERKVYSTRFGKKASRKETTWKIKAQMVGWDKKKS
jgi:hypothetical protein